MTNAFDWRNFMKEEIKEQKEELPPKTQAVFDFTTYKYPYDITGFRFGRLVALVRGKELNGHYLWDCVCDCGNQTKARGFHLKTGKIKSCGCIKVENCKELAVKNRKPVDEV